MDSRSRHHGDPTDDTFDRGLELFNRGEYFACHEVWEDLWRRSTGSDKLFYQGLIQAAAAILHAERASPRGAAAIWRKARVKLAAATAQHQAPSRFAPPVTDRCGSHPHGRYDPSEPGCANPFV
jgi:Domain of unknown function (DUF309)